MGELLFDKVPDQTTRLWAERELHRAHCRYARALDCRDWSLLEQVFAEDALAVYGEGPPLLGRAAIIAAIRGFLDGCGPSQHLIGNLSVDEMTHGSAKTCCYVRAAHKGAGKERQVYWSLGQYDGHWRATPDGWRAERWIMRIQFNDGDDGVFGPFALIDARQAPK